MAKTGVNIGAQVAGIVSDAKAGKFKPVYLLMGEESYYPDRVCDAIMQYAVEEDARDFDQFVYYGSDTDAETVITAARGYSMFGGRVLVVLKEAQLMKDLEQLSVYLQKPLDSTVLVILLHGATVDKRKALYKAAQQIGEVLDSPALRDYEVPGWIGSYYASRGMQIDPPAAALLAEYAGTSIDTIVLETDKMLKNLPEGSTRIVIEDVEKNVGISRKFSIFELTKTLSERNAAKALSLAAHLSDSASFQMPAAVSALFTHFYRILKYEALLKKDPYPSSQAKASVLGVNPYFFREYDAAVRNYPLDKCMSVISLLNDYDYKGKGGDVGPYTSPDNLFVELITKILNI